MTVYKHAHGSYAIVSLLRILIVASAVFYYGEGKDRSNSQDPASLFDAHDLLKQYVGKREQCLRRERPLKLMELL